MRYWRGARGRSQFDLSLDSGVSQRHISFIESGRSSPGRETLTALAQALDIPLRERNLLLLAAGYAPIYTEGEWDAPEMKSIAGALDRMLRQHEPFPAVVLDRDWNVIRANASAPRFFGLFVDMAARPRPRNILHLMFDPAGMRPFIRDWKVTAASLIERVHREAVGRVIDDRTRTLLAALAAYPDVKTEWGASPASALPVIPLRFLRDGETLSYFSLVTTVGTPLTIRTQELRIESMFPADEATERRHHALMREAPIPLPSR